MVSTSLGTESFTDLDCVEYMSVLAEMLYSTVRPHNQLVEDQDLDNTRPATLGNHVPIRGHEVEIVESFPYLGCRIHCTGECDGEPEIKPQSLVNVRWMALDRIGPT